MRSLRFFDHRTREIVAASGLLLATLSAALVPAFASAETATGRSIALSSASKGAENVSHTVTFTPVTSAGAVVVEYCSESPTIGDTCTTPTGFDASAATVTSGSFTKVSSTANNVIVEGTLTAGTPATFELNGIDNPSDAGQIYARIISFDTAAHASSETETGADVKDTGGVAIAITDTVGVTAAVQESLTFCAANQVITANCGDAYTTGHEPTIKLGETVGGATALSASALSTGTIFTQLSTNAVDGAVVNIKNANDCGGLKRTGAAVCDIAASNDTTFGANEAKFGMKVATDDGQDDETDASGATLAAASIYDDTNYLFKYTGTSTGVSSTYGDPAFSVSGPTNNRNMNLTFGASISNSTPAGSYGTSLSLIATGKF